MCSKMEAMTARGHMTIMTQTNNEEQLKEGSGSRREHTDPTVLLYVCVCVHVSLSGEVSMSTRSLVLSVIRADEKNLILRLSANQETAH